MKIQGQDLIRLAGSARVRDIMKNIPAGIELKAEIVQRFSGNTALLNIQGKKIRAEFINGAPKTRFINLKFEKTMQDTYIFSIVNHHDKESLQNKLSEFIILSGSSLKEKTGEIIRLLNSSITGIYELNRILIDPERNNKKQKQTVHLLNTLLKNGLRKDALFFLSLIISGADYNRDILFFIYSLLNNHEILQEKYFRLKNNEIEDIITDISNELECINDKELRNDMILRVLEALLLHNRSENDIKEGELFIFNDSEFKAVNYFFTFNSLIFTLNLSNLGILEIVAKKGEKGIFINIFSDNERVIENLKKSQGILLSNLHAKRGDISVNFINTKIMLDNLKDFYRNYMVNNIDLKV